MNSGRQKRVILNVSGEIFETCKNTLNRFPNTLLSTLDIQSPYYCLESNQYFFNRSRQCFGAILFYYQSNGILSCPPDIPVNIFADECVFFNIPDVIIYRMKIKEGILPRLQMAEERQSSLRTRCWDILENPETSSAARTFAITSLVIISLSIILTYLETIPALRIESNILTENPWSIIELLLNSWFLFELLARFITSPAKYDFVTSVLNWIDGAAVLPYFIMFIIRPGEVHSLGFIRIFRFLRIVRIFRASNNSTQLNVIMEVLTQCIGYFQMLFLCFIMVVILGGSLIYHIEVSSNVDFTSIPESIWWAIVTVTTVGYGDIVPITILGRLLTGAFMIFGAVTLLLPIISIVTTFMTIYMKNIEGNM